MRLEHLHLLRCPVSGTPLTLTDTEMEQGRVRSGFLVSPEGRRYRIEAFIPRFVSADNYSSSFGFQWLKHARTQFDDALGLNISQERLFGTAGWPRRLPGETILEAGSGAGRFTEHLLATGATVVSFDYSGAVEANYAANGSQPSLLLVQADVLAMPFAPASFDRVICMGVLQHTPNPRSSFQALVHMPKAGGELVSDIYLRTFKRYWLNTRYWVRPLTRSRNPERLYSWVERYVTAMWPVVKVLRRLPDRIGEALVWRLLIADYGRQFPSLSDEKLRQLAILDTFDMLSPAYDNPATPSQFRGWHVAAGLKDIDVRPGANGLIGRGRTS